MTEERREEARHATGPRRVAVVHGRNHQVRDGMFQFLRALDLKPVAWHDAIQQTGKGSPHTREVLEALFSTTRAVVVLLTGDDDAALRPYLRTEPGDERVRAQARPNVWIEAGMALGVNPERTILVRFGDHAEPSDIHGLQYVRFDGSASGRHDLRVRLETAQCAVKVSEDEWLRAGQPHFETALRAERETAKVTPRADAPVSPEAIWDCLTENERTLLIALWQSEDTFLSDLQVMQLRTRCQWGHATWNGMLVSLENLIDHLPLYRGNRQVLGWWLTSKGREVVAAADKRDGPLVMPLAPPADESWRP